MDPEQTPPPPREAPAAPESTMPEAPDREAKEKIRLRRLAKLGNSTRPAAEASTSSADPESSSDSRSPSASTPAAQPKLPTEPSPTKLAMSSSSDATTAPANPFSQIVPKKAGASPSAAQPSIPGSSVSGPLSLKRGPPEQGDAGEAKPRRTHVIQVESLADFADRVLTDILRATVDSKKLTDGKGNELAFLSSLSQDLADTGEPLKLTAGNLDSAIMEAASMWPANKPLLKYLLPCWERAQTHRKAPPKHATPEKIEVLEEAKRLCISNALFAVTMPDLFNREHATEPGLVPHLLLEPTHPEGIDDEFLAEAVARFSENELLPKAFTDAMVTISSQLNPMSMEVNFKPYVNALLLYCKFPTLLDLLAQHPCFQMAQSARGIEDHTILGPFFKLSPLRPETIQVFFAAPRTMDRTAIANSQTTMRAILEQHQNDLFTITNAFVRASLETRGKTLDWFAYIMNTNHKRRAIQVNPKEVASDAFMLNVTRVLDRLCEPFMDNSFSKVDRINVEYFRQNPRLDIKDETKLNADQAASDAFYAETAPGSPNFISEVFFLTLAAHHYGLEGTVSKLKNLEREIKFYEKNVKSMEAERAKFINNAAQLALFDSTFKKHVVALEKAMGLRASIEGLLQDPKMQEISLRFMRYVAVWLLRVASQTAYSPSKTLHLPFPEKQPDVFACLPEYALQNVVENFKFAYRYLPQIVSFSAGDELVALCIAFLQCSEYIKNPYLKSSLVTLLCAGTWPSQQHRSGVLTDLLTTSKFANDHLLHALIKFYIECESTGAHNQFYDKFNIRYEIFQVIKVVWRGNIVYSQRLTQESNTNREFFVRFVNLLLNDATYVLDEAMGKFPKIQNLQTELKTKLSPADRQKKEEDLASIEGLATSYMQLANETVEMMRLFTKALREAFTMPEIVHRLASMLNYNLETLAGPKASQLRVENSSKYSFRPKELLSDLVDIYINLGPSADFIEAVAADGRSYKPASFDRASMILTRKTTKDPAEIQQWDKIKEQFLEAKIRADQAELDLGDIPPEFEDPIMGDLMKDPVILPSRHVVDRSTIVQHLLSDPKDPFTRQPMTIADAIPDVDLKARITVWREEKIATATARMKEAAAAQAMAEEETEDAKEAEEAVAAAVVEEGSSSRDAMDTTEG